MKKLLWIVVLGLLVVSCGKGKTVKMECDSLKHGTMEWRYNDKKVSEMYPGKARVYNVEKKSNGKTVCIIEVKAFYPRIGEALVCLVPEQGNKVRPEDRKEDEF